MTGEPVTCRVTDDQDEFVEHTLPFLLVDPVNCTVLLGRTTSPGPTSSSGRRAGEPDLFCWAQDATGAVLVAGVTGPRGLWLSPGPAVAGGPLALALHREVLHRDMLHRDMLHRDMLHREGGSPASVEGSPQLVEAFARAWCEQTGLDRVAGRKLGVFDTTQVRSPGGVPGRMRVAGDADAPILEGWARDFVLAVDGVRIDAYALGDRIALGHVVVWEDGAGPVSMAAALPHAGVSAGSSSSIPRRSCVAGATRRPAWRP